MKTCYHHAENEPGTFKIIEGKLQIVCYCMKCKYEYRRDPTIQEQKKFEELKQNR